MIRSSNRTGLAYAREVPGSLGVLPGTPVWIQGEPNTYNDHGGTLSRVARQPINASRQVKKGSVTDKDAVAGYQTDFTQTNLNSLLEGFFFADFRILNSKLVTAVSGTAYTVGAAHGYLVNDLVFGSGFAVSGNNGFKLVTAVAASTISAAGLAIEGSPPAIAKVEKVGIQGVAADIKVDASGDITSIIFDFTTLNLVPGEWIFVGGDAANTFFGTAANNGFKRLSAITANKLTIDKTFSAMALDAGTGITLRIFVGKRLRNEPISTDIKVYSHQFERSLAGGGFEYVLGAIGNTMNISVNTASKIEIDLNFIGTNTETVTEGTGAKAGTRQALVSENLFNTSSDIRRMKIASTANVSLADFLTEFQLSLNNNLTPNKAVANLGAVGVTEGFFQINGTSTAYFTDVATITAVQNDTDVTIDLIFVKNNAGFAFDIPLLGLGDGKPDIQINSPILLPLSFDAGESPFGHTVLLVQFPYLPNLA